MRGIYLSSIGNNSMFVIAVDHLPLYLYNKYGISRHSCGISMFNVDTINNNNDSYFAILCAIENAVTVCGSAVVAVAVTLSMVNRKIAKKTKISKHLFLAIWRVRRI